MPTLYAERSVRASNELLPIAASRSVWSWRPWRRVALRAEQLKLELAIPRAIAAAEPPFHDSALPDGVVDLRGDVVHALLLEQRLDLRQLLAPRARAHDARQSSELNYLLIASC